MSLGPPPGFLTRHAWAPYFLVTVTVLLFASNSIVGRAVREDIPPMGFTFWRGAVAALLLLPFVLGGLRAQLPVLREHWKLILVLGFTQSVGGQAFLYVGLHTTTAINAGVIDATRPVLTIALAWLLLGHQISLRQILGLAIAIAGALTVIARGDFQSLLALEFVVGDLWVQLAILSFAAYAVAVSRVPAALSPLVLLEAILVAAFLCTLPVYLGEMLIGGARVRFDLATVGTIFYIAILVSIGAVLLLNTAIAHVGPGKAGTVFYLMPVFTAALAVALLGETLQAFHLVGTALVFAGLYVAARRTRGTRE